MITNPIELNYPFKIERDKRHRYTIDGVGVPGVTSIKSILPKRLEKWASEQCSKTIYEAVEKVWRETGATPSISDFAYICDEAITAYAKQTTKAADTGTIVHGMCENYIRGLEVAKVEEGSGADTGFKNFLRWEKEHNVVWRGVELMVGAWEEADGRGYAGQLDAIAEINGVLTLVDFKTSKRIYEDYWVQLAAYYNALPKHVSSEIKDWQILRFDKERLEFETESVVNPVLHIETFKACLKLHGLLKNYKRILK